MKYGIKYLNNEICAMIKIPDAANFMDDFTEVSETEYENAFVTLNKQISSHEPKLPNDVIRKEKYISDTCINWEGKQITIDAANKLWYNYFAEGNDKANELQSLIKSSKEIIRTNYPD